MAKKGSSRHIKRLNAPEYFAIHRKEHKYATKPRPGRHTLKSSVPIATLLEKLSLARTSAEAKKVLDTGTILVNGKPVHDRKYAIGLNDMVDATLEGKRFMIGINEQGHVTAEPAEKKDAGVYKVLGKYKTKKGVLMIRLHDGTAMQGSTDIHVNDSVIVEKGKVKSHIGLEKGAKCEIIGGRHSGTQGVVKELLKGAMNRQGSAIIERKDGSSFETLTRNVIATK